MLSERCLFQTSVFVKEAHDLGPLPSDDTQLVPHFNKMLKLEKDYMQETKRLYSSIAGLLGRKTSMGDWRQHIGKTGLAQRRCRLWRAFMVRGYTDKRFEYATKTCVEAAQESLDCLKKLYELNAPFSSLCKRQVTHRAMYMRADACCL